MKNKVINSILTIIEIIFFVSLIKRLPFDLNIYYFLPVVAYGIIKVFLIKKSPTRKSIFVTFSSIMLSIIFINIYTYIKNFYYV